MSSEQMSNQTAAVPAEEANQSLRRHCIYTEIFPQDQLSFQAKLQHIKQEKRNILKWPLSKKLLKLANCSSCQSSGCYCPTWQNSQPPIPESSKTFTDPCRRCTHTLEKHISHLRKKEEQKINELLGMAVDMDNLFMNIPKGEDIEITGIYQHFIKFLCKCIVRIGRPINRVEQEAVEKPCIAKAVKRFVLYKFCDSEEREKEAMNDAANIFLYCINNWNFELPSERRTRLPNEEQSNFFYYNYYYSRWLISCHLPRLGDSLPHYNTADICGKTMLRAVFKLVCQQLLDKCPLPSSESDDIFHYDKRYILVSTHFPK